MFCYPNRWDSLANCLFTMCFTDIEILCSRKAPVFLENCFSASSSGHRDSSVSFCWLTSRENWHNACPTPITISLEAVSTAVFSSSFKQSRIGVHFTPSVQIIPLISFPFWEPLFHESNGSEKGWRPGSHGTDVNCLWNWSLTPLVFMYLSSQCNTYLLKPRSSWFNSSGYETW